MTSAGVIAAQSPQRWMTASAITFIVSMAALVHAFLGLKLLLMAVFLAAFIVSVFRGRIAIVVYPRLLWFYVSLALVGVVWAVVGLVHSGNYVQGIFDALRLYVVWSVAFAFLYTLFRTGTSLNAMHHAMCLAGIVIPLLNFVALYDVFTGSALMPETIRQALFLEIGIDSGYVQFGSANISTMFVIAPYLLALQFRSDAHKRNNLLTKIALALSLLLVGLSGRRALWIVVVLTPVVILTLSGLTRSNRQMSAGGRRFLRIFAVAGLIGLAAVVTVPNGTGPQAAWLGRLRDAFSSEDERTIQRPYLLRGFTESPALGSGFGGYAGYQRNAEEPWTYELTYYTMLFNLGLVGTGCLVALFVTYFVSVIRLLGCYRDESAIPFAMLVGFSCLLIGAYSNPYLGGFDSLFLIGFLPYLSTFQSGFARVSATDGGRL